MPGPLRRCDCGTLNNLLVSPLRRCDCGTLNNLLVNPIHCWQCQKTWAEQGGRRTQVTTGL